jgi:hypothetical protein
MDVEVKTTERKSVTAAATGTLSRGISCVQVLDNVMESITLTTGALRVN